MFLRFAYAAKESPKGPAPTINNGVETFILRLAHPLTCLALIVTASRFLRNPRGRFVMICSQSLRPLRFDQFHAEGCEFIHLFRLEVSQCREIQSVGAEKDDKLRKSLHGLKLF